MSIMFRSVFTAIFAAVLVAAVPAGASAQGVRIAQIDLPAQPLSQAIQAVARQASLNILVDPVLVEGRQAPALKGEISVDQALALLLEGSGLIPRHVDDKTIALVPEGTGAALPTGDPTIRLAQADTSADPKSSGETAARAGPSGIAEVTVTARRRSESAQDVPISIVSKSGEDLAQSGVQSVTELSRVVPGFIFNQFEAGQQSTAQIRGLSSFAFQTHAPQSVGIVVDDVVLSVMGQGVADFSDIERVEVLRGPQGTLFGRNTTGGVVHIVTKDPTDDFEGKVSAGYGSYDEVRWNGTLNGPLSENVAARASVFTSDREGYIENIHDGRMLSNEQQAGINTKFLYTPSESTRLKFTATYIERHQQGRADPAVAFGPTTSNQDRLVNGGLVGPHNDKVNGVGFHPFDEKSGAANIAWNQDLGDFELTSISAYEYWKFEFGRDQPFRTFNAPVEPLGIIRFYVPNQLHGWSQEIRLASPQGRRVEYVTGLFASGMKLYERRHFLFNLSEDADPAAALYLFTLGDQNTEHRDYAFFGEADFHMTDKLTLTGGVRWTHDKTSVTLDGKPTPFYDPDEGVGIGPLGEIYLPFLDSEFPGLQALSTSKSELTWRAGLRFEPTSDLMFYGTAARGFKGPTITALGLLSPVKSEIAKSYEVGTKAEFLDRRLTVNLTVYRADVDNLQAQGEDTIQTPRGPIGSIFLTNAAKARSEGIEFELSAAPTERLGFDLGFAYIDAKFRDYPRASCFDGQTPQQGCNTAVEPNLQDLSGKRMPLVPRWSGNAAMNYDFPATLLSSTPFMRLDYSYQDEINWSSSLNPRTVSDAVGIWGLTAGLRSTDGRFEVLGYIKNLTDEFVVNGLDGGNGTITADLLPEYQRTWGVTVNYNFR